MFNQFKKGVSCISILAVLFLTAVSLQAAERTIVGEVNDTLQIVTDDQIYEVQSNDVGDDLVFNHIGEKVKATGTIRTEDDLQVIEVSAFEVVEE